MEFTETANHALNLLHHLHDSPTLCTLKPDEKIAVLEAAKNIISATLMAESMKLIYYNVLVRDKK